MQLHDRKPSLRSSIMIQKGDAKENQNKGRKKNSTQH
jgi:hypothetical protein